MLTEFLIGKVPKTIRAEYKLCEYHPWFIIFIVCYRFKLTIKMICNTWCKTLSLSASLMKGCLSSSFRAFHLHPSSFEISALCLSGWTSTILRRSNWDQTMKAFIGRLMWLGVCFFVWKEGKTTVKNLYLTKNLQSNFFHMGIGYHIFEMEQVIKVLVKLYEWIYRQSPVKTPDV